MKALLRRSLAAGDVGLDEIPEPSPGPGQVKVKVEYGGICSSDALVFRLELPDGGKFIPPVVLGHEGVGVVVEAAPDVQRPRIGDRVVVDTTVTHCGVCRYCRSGAYNMCAERTGLGSRADGFFAEYMIARAAGCYVIAPGVDALAAAATEPLACAANGLVAQANLTVGDWVVVFGPGAIGQGAAQLARAAGARVILVGSAHSRPRLDIARSTGIDYTLSGDGAHVLEEINRITGGQGADIAVEAVGSGEVLNTAMRCVRKLGQLVVLACPMGAAQVDVVTLLLHQIRVYGAVSHGSAAWDTAVKLVNSGQVNLAPLVSDVFPLSEWQQALAKVESHEGLKVLLKP